jgi:hypothetical protein
MERRQDLLLRAIVEQVSRTSLTPPFQLTGRWTTDETRWVRLGRAHPTRGRHELVLYHAADQQYVGAQLREAGLVGRQRAARLDAELWSYRPNAAQPTWAEVLPAVVSTWEASRAVARGV